MLKASLAIDPNRETAADPDYLRSRGTSLGGLRPKCTVIDGDGALSIGKFPSITDGRAATKGAFLALTLARNAGIDGAEATEPGDRSNTGIVDAIRVHGADPQADIEELWRRIAFSILITNVDDHLLYHGPLHEDRGFRRLSPAFVASGAA